MGFMVEADAVREAGVRLITVVDDIETDLVSVRAQVDRLLSGGWTGSAARSMASAWQEWLTGFSTSTSALRTMSNGLARCAEAYDQAEHVTSQSLAAIAGAYL